jgi:hypothetical protein
MTQMRLYSVKTGPVADTCDGCHAVIPPSSQAVMRADRALFCNVACAMAHDDAPIGLETVALA